MSNTAITTITHRDRVYHVDELPGDIQAIVDFISDWKNRETNLVEELELVRSAIEHKVSQLSTSLDEYITTTQEGATNETPN